IAVRKLAFDELADRGKEALQILGFSLETPSHPGTDNRHALMIWLLDRLDRLDYGSMQRLIDKGSPLVRTHALKILAERRLDPIQRNSEFGHSFGPGLPLKVRGALRDPDARVRRAAAEALAMAKHPSYADVQQLIAARKEVPAGDTHLLHAI